MAKKLTIDEALVLQNPQQFITGVEDFFKDKVLRIEEIKKTNKNRILVRVLIALDKTDYAKYGLPENTTNEGQTVSFFSKDTATVSSAFAKSMRGQILKIKPNAELSYSKVAGNKLYIYTNDIEFYTFNSDRDKPSKRIPNEIIYNDLYNEDVL